jgi:hypothetical protein
LTLALLGPGRRRRLGLFIFSRLSLNLTRWASENAQVRRLRPLSDSTQVQIKALDLDFEFGQGTLDLCGSKSKM